MQFHWLSDPSKQTCRLSNSQREISKAATPFFLRLHSTVVAQLVLLLKAEMIIGKRASILRPEPQTGRSSEGKK